MARSTALVAFTRVAILALGTSGAACKSDPESKPPAPTVAAAPADAGPRTVELPDGGCRLTSSSSLHGVPLHLGPDGPPYGTAGTSMMMMGSFGTRSDAPPPTFAVEVVVPEGPAAAIGLRYQTDRLAVRGFVRPEDIEIHPARATVTGGFLITTRVRITRVAGAQATIEPALGTEIELIGADPPPTVACTELSLAEPDGPRALAPAAKGDDVRMALGHGTVELAVEPDGPAVARLHANADSDLVQVLERRGTSTRILWYRDGAIVFGWIPSSALAEPPLPEGLMGERVPRPPAALAALRCGHEVPVSVDVGGVRAIIGAARAGATIEVEERAGAAVRIHPIRPPGGPFPDVEPSPGVTFWVDHRDLEDCPAAPPEPPDDRGLDLGLEGLGNLPAKRD